MATFDFDHAVVGGGTVGSWTALHLVRKGKKVLLLEQFSQPHTRGSSHGSSRIIRSSYVEPFYCEMMPHACRIWKEAELETGQKLIEHTGLLCIANTEKSKADFEAVVANMKHFCPDYVDTADPRIGELLSSLLHYPDATGALWDSSGGIILAHKSVLTIQALFRERGGEHWENCPVQRIEPLGQEAVRLHLSGGEHDSKVVTVRSVVVSAGTWTKKLLSPFVSLPLQPATVRVYYWKPKEEGAYSEKSGFPTVIDMNTPEVYSLPSYEYPGLVKVCLHAGVPCDPDERDKTSQDPKNEEFMKEYVRQHYPMLEDQPSIVETCMYTLTPDGIYLIDHVPGHQNIVIGSACNGMGFKTSPAVGKILCEMAIGVEPFLDITPYRLSRFEQFK